jgi:hypothetical protein
MNNLSFPVRILFMATFWLFSFLVKRNRSRKLCLVSGFLAALLIYCSLASSVLSRFYNLYLSLGHSGSIVWYVPFPQDREIYRSQCHQYSVVYLGVYPRKVVHLYPRLDGHVAAEPHCLQRVHLLLTFGVCCITLKVRCKAGNRSLIVHSPVRCFSSMLTRLCPPSRLVCGVGWRQSPTARSPRQVQRLT